MQCKKLKKSEGRTRHILEGDFSSLVGKPSTCPFHPSSSNRCSSWRKSITTGDSNQGCSRRNDGEDLPHDKIKNPYISKPLKKRRKI